MGSGRNRLHHTLDRRAQRCDPTRQRRPQPHIASPCRQDFTPHAPSGELPAPLSPGSFAARGPYMLHGRSKVARAQGADTDRDPRKSKRLLVQLAAAGVAQLPHPPRVRIWAAGITPLFCDCITRGPRKLVVTSRQAVLHRGDGRIAGTCCCAYRSGPAWSLGTDGRTPCPARRIAAHDDGEKPRTKPLRV